MAVDITTGRFQSGKRFVAFREAGAGAGEQQLVSKDNTTTKQHFQIFYAVLSCLTGYVRVFDGSSRAMSVLALQGGAGDITQGWATQVWDFRDDPMDCTNEDGTSICISAAGTFDGFIKWGWGV